MANTDFTPISVTPEVLPNGKMLLGYEIGRSEHDGWQVVFTGTGALIEMHIKKGDVFWLETISLANLGAQWVDQAIARCEAAGGRGVTSIEDFHNSKEDN